ncbi:Gfo/Idh/MocA family protein [Planctomicrobium sp. SH668]|uniref:Gfo/Idh/MocA family protein n=1 Tax=Planctomicrobium sp. SH668 TaxID=3448126 RepID=UPI003F5B2E79
MAQSIKTTNFTLPRRNFLQTAGFATVTTLLNPSLASAHSQVAPPKWNVAVIGHSGQGNYGHGLDTMWSELPQANVIAFADANNAGREKEQSKLPHAVAYADYRKMLAETKPDIVVVAPRAIAEHRDMIMAAINAGAKGIYCEKPFCRTPAEADEILSACQRHKCRLAIAHRNHYHPALEVALKALKSGEIGDLLELRGRGKEDHRGGCLDLWVLGSHVFDLARYFAGNPIACSANLYQGVRLAVPTDLREGDEGIGLIAGDRLHARFDMENGLPFYFDSIKGVTYPAANFGLQLIGNKGIIDLRIDIEPVAHLIPGNPFHPTAEPRPWIPISSAGIGVNEPIVDVGKQVALHTLAARDLLSAIEQEREPLCSAEDGRSVVEMSHAIYASHRHHGQRIQLPLENRGHGLDGWK